ncbi:MAG: HD domain-containing protein [Lachnospiraceae bacterium]|jgi:putative hydrolase of HD superfamily|nr:HD domain-containing protein [Lachnospiraceae bacterium]MDY6335123.1 HD domain-containing protein [Lachnospiraceae bacterium]
MTKEQRERLQQQLQFILEIDKEKNILRQTHLSGHGRRENDAEHAWHMTVMAYLLQEYANEKVDIAHVMILCLIHDLVEIDAGDTYAYDEKGKKTQREREERAADRIFGLLPEDQQKLLHALFEEFDAGQTAEAKFARSMDNLQPLLLNHSNGGSDWLEHGVSRQTVEKRQGKTRLGSAVLGELTEEILDANEEAGHFQKE